MEFDINAELGMLESQGFDAEELNDETGRTPPDQLSPDVLATHAGQWKMILRKIRKGKGSNPAAIMGKGYSEEYHGPDGYCRACWMHKNGMTDEVAVSD